MEHIGQFPCACRDISLDGMGERVHTSRRCQSLWHGCHHLGIDKCNDGYVFRIHADHLAVLCHVRDDIVDRHLRCCSGSRRHREDRYGLILRGRHTLEAHYVLKLRIVDDDADRLRRVHGRATADRDQIIRAGFLICRHAGLYVLHCRVWLDLRIQLIGHPLSVEDIQYSLRHAEFHQIGIGAHKCLLKSPSFCLGHDILDRACPMIRCLVQYESVCHNFFSFSYSV